MEALTNGLFHICIVDQLLPKCLGDRFAGYIVSGWTKAAGGNNKVCPFPGIGKKSFNIFWIVTDDKIYCWLDPMMSKLGTKVGEV